MKEKIGAILIVIYFLFFIGYSYPKIHFMSGYMLLFKGLMYVTILVWYFISVKQVNYKYLLILFFFVIADLSGIYAGTYKNLSTHSFFAGNLVLIYMINVKINRCLTGEKAFFKGINTIIIVLTLMYIMLVLFASFMFVIICFALLVALLLYVSYRNYLQSVNKPSFLMLAGIISLTVCYAFTAINKFLSPYIYYSLLDGLAYAVALYLITRAVIIEDSNYLEITE